jgi:hypothetical protein
MENKLYESGMSNKELNNPFSKNLANTNMSSFNENLFNNPLLKQTKKSVKELIDYNTEFQDAKQSTGERIDQNNVDKILSPIYEKLNEIKKKMTTINNDILYNYNENKPNTIDEIFNAHQYLEINKNNLDDTLVYMKETIAKVHYEQIGKDIDELILFLETLYNEIDIMENNYYKKFNTIIREKKRQNYENDILNGKNDRIDVTKYLNKNNNSNNIDYNEYKNDLDDIMFEKDDLMLRYANDREEAKRNLPKLMKPSDKTYFSYDIPELNKKEKNEKENEDNLSKDKNKNNIESNKENDEKISNEKSKITNEKINKLLDEIEDDEEKEKKLSKPKMTPTEKMTKYQQHMLDLSSQIQTKDSRQTKQRKVIHIGKSKQDSKRTKQPRSLNSKRTLQDFQRKKMKPIYEYDEENKIPNDLLKKGKFTKITNIEINIPEGMSEDEFNKECEKNILIYIRNALRETRPNEDKLNIEFESKKEIYTADDFLKLLIEKFDGLNNELKNRKNNLNQSGRNINDKIAERIINELNEIDVNIDRSNEFNKSDTLHNIIEKKEKKIKISERRKREIEKEKEEGKKIKIDDGKRIPLFESTDKISIEELDKLIQMPHKINLSDYNVSNSSSYLSESLNQKNLNQILEYHEKNIYSQNEESDNSISRGQALSDENDESNSFNRGKYDYNTKNRTGLDLLMIKNFNERLPEQILKDKINYSDNSEISNSFFNDNDEVVDIDNKERLKMLNLYKSEEYNQFKNNFINQVYNNNNNQ